MAQPDRRPVGRPRVNSEGTGDGNPTVQIRMPIEKKEGVNKRGGSTWARSIIDRHLIDELDDPVIPAEVVDYRHKAGVAILCRQCKQLKRYGLLVNVSDGETGLIDLHFCKACLAGWAELLPGEDAPSVPSGCEPEGLGN